MGKTGKIYPPACQKIFHTGKLACQASMKIFNGTANNLPFRLSPRFCDIGIEASSATEMEDPAVCTFSIYSHNFKIFRVCVPHMPDIIF